jgi:Fe-S-cluster-containing dehydrogenase component
MDERKPEAAAEKDVTRRGFLTATGAVAVGIGCGVPILAALASDSSADKTDGPRWAMVVDTRKCEAKGDCKDCTLACHQVHNVPEIDSDQEEVKWIWKEPYKHAFLGQESEYMRAGMKEMPVTVMCNHCENPPCVRVCPTQATFKRDDGIVLMDMHRCIGCRYCIVACPYGSRSFNWSDPWPRGDDNEPTDRPPNPEFPTRMRGVVEKCNFCAERLGTEQKPACVEACECEALTFGNLNDPDDPVRLLLVEELSQRRRPELGTNPHVFYLV